MHVEVINEEAESTRRGEGSSSNSSSSSSISSSSSVAVVVKERNGSVSSDTADGAPIVVVQVTPEPVESRSRCFGSLTCLSDGDSDEDGTEEEEEKDERIRDSARLDSPGSAIHAGVASVSSDSDNNNNDGAIAENPLLSRHREALHSPHQAALPRSSVFSAPQLSSSYSSSLPSSLAAAPILRVSRLTDYFTYGVQAAMTHYVEHFYDRAEEGEEDAEEEGGVTFRCTGRVTPRYHDSFLTHQHSRRGDAIDRDPRSRSSSAATYDSDAAVGPSSSQRSREASTAPATVHLLEPQTTSLYHVPPSCAVGRTTAGESWSEAMQQSASNTTAGVHVATEVVDGASPTRSATYSANNVQGCFREALRRAYVCEDAARQLRRDEANRQREQLLQTLTKLKTDSNSITKNGRGTSTKQRGKDDEHTGRGHAKSSSSVEDNSVVQPMVQMGTLAVAPAAAAAAPSRHILQVMDPSQLCKLHRTPNVLVDTLLKHHREMQQKQRAAQCAEDQAIHVRRLYELPTLAEDIVRYAALILCMKRSQNRPSSTPAAADVADVAAGVTSRGSGQGALQSPVNRVPSPTNHNNNNADPTAAAAAPLSSAVECVDGGIPPYGEDGSLLYVKYPAPLLRTTSFAVETVRLLKWLRTWCSSGAANETALSSPSSLPMTSATASQQHPRKRVKTEAVVEGRRAAEAQDVSAAGSPASASGARHVPRSAVEEAHRQTQRAQRMYEAQVKQKKRSAFLKFFGAAVAPSSVKQEDEAVAVGTVEQANSAETHATTTASEFVGGEKAKSKRPPSASLTSVHSTATRVSGEGEEHSVVQQSLSRTFDSTNAVNNNSSNAAAAVMPSPSPPLRLVHPAVYAYQLYCHAWRHAVKTGITPLATVAQAFAGSRHGIAGSVSLSPQLSESSSNSSSRTMSRDTVAGGTVSRVCAALPFYKEIQAEARRTALGSAARGAYYYEDAYGNRLRSARLAQKEQAELERQAAQQRRRARRKGYFHRDDKVEAATGRSAAAMLEAMLSTSTDAQVEHRAALRLGKKNHRQKKRRRPRSSSSSSTYEGKLSPMYVSDDNGRDEETGKAVGGRAGQNNVLSRRARSSSAESSSDSNSNSSHPSDGSSSSGSPAAADDDDVAAKDEITNIAVVSGPTGAGKTAAVYVAAQLLGFRVVEMNASVRRCSRTVEHLLAELTRSYRLSGLRAGSSGFNAEEELTKLKQQHAALLEKARAEAAAAEREAGQRKREARKANGISAQAVANFFFKSGTSKVSGKTSTQQPTATNVDDEAAEEDTVVQVPPSALSAASASSSPPPPPLLSSTPTSAQTATAAATASPVGTRTLLLFEDADILLGDESAKPFYAAIRDLAHRSKVPIVVTVSDDPAPSQRYDTAALLSPLAAAAAATSTPRAIGRMSVTEPEPTTATSLQTTYWQLCDAVGANTAMDSLAASYDALHASPVLGDRASNAIVSDSGAGASAGNLTGGTGSGPGLDSGNGHSGGSSSSQNSSGPTASFLSFFSPSTTIAASAASAAASGGPGSSSPANLGGNHTTTTTSSAGAASTLAARYTHVLLNASLVSSFFGAQTPFTVVEALPSSALYAQLLAVGAVELDLLQWQHQKNEDSPLFSREAVWGTSQPAGFLPQHSQMFPMPSSASWQQDVDRLTCALRLRDPALFFELAALLCHALFGTSGEASKRHDAALDFDTTGVRDSATQRQGAGACEAPTLLRAIQLDAAGRTTTDIRYWLNRLQMMLLGLQAQSASQQQQQSNAAVLGTGAKSAQEPLHPQGRNSSHDDDNGVALTGRKAERLLEREFQQCASRAASEWDRMLGHYMASIAHNELHSSRYEYWLLEDHVDYVADILGELNTQNCPALHVDYAAAPSVAATQPGSVRRGRPASASAKVDEKKGGQGGGDGDGGAAPIAKAPTEVVTHASAIPSPPSTSNGDNNGGGLNPVWKALFGGAKSNAPAASTPISADPAASPPPPSPASVLPGGQQTLFGFPRCLTKSGPPAAASSAVSSGAVFDLPTRYEWPPSLHELRQQADRDSSNSSSTPARRRPVELLLPYSTAQPYYDTVATTTASSALYRVPDIAEPSPLLLGHDTPLRFVNRQGGREMMAEKGDVCDVTDELPSSVYVTQEERFAVFRRWWRRPRKVGALRDSVAGRSSAVLEDMLGHGCLLAPSAAAAANNNNREGN